jgi:hypothetical protein
MENQVLVRVQGDVFAFGKLSHGALATLKDRGALVAFHKALASGGRALADAFLLELNLPAIKPLEISDLSKDSDPSWVMTRIVAYQNTPIQEVLDVAMVD